MGKAKPISLWPLTTEQALKLMFEAGKKDNPELPDEFVAGIVQAIKEDKAGLGKPYKNEKQSVTKSVTKASELVNKPVRPRKSTVSR